MLDTIVILLILLAAWLQSRHGIFQALVTLLSCLIATATALTLYQYFAKGVLGGFPAYGAPVSLTVLFVATFAILRFGLQMLVHHDIHMGKWPDQIGGGIVGIFCGLLVGGVFAVLVQTLPMGAKALGYQPYGPDLRRQSSALMSCDTMVLSIANAASAALGDDSFAEQNTSEPLLALQCNRNTAGMALRAVPITSKLFESNSIKLYQLVKDEAPQALCAVANNRNPAWTNRYMLRMNVSHTLVPKGEKVGETKVDPWWRLPASHFAILAEKKVKGKVVASARFYPVAYAALTPKGQWTAWQAEDRNALFVARSDRVVLDYVEYIQSLIDQEKVKKPSGTAPPRLYSRHLWLTVDWVYCLPEGYAPKAFLYRDSLRESLKDTFPFAEMELRKRALHIRSPDEKKKKSKRRR